MLLLNHFLSSIAYCLYFTAYTLQPVKPAYESLPNTLDSVELVRYICHISAAVITG